MFICWSQLSHHPNHHNYPNYPNHLDLFQTISKYENLWTLSLFLVLFVAFSPFFLIFLNFLVKFTTLQICKIQKEGCAISCSSKTSKMSTHIKPVCGMSVKKKKQLNIFKVVRHMKKHHKKIVGEILKETMWKDNVKLHR